MRGPGPNINRRNAKAGLAGLGALRLLPGALEQSGQCYSDCPSSMVTTAPVIASAASEHR